MSSRGSLPIRSASFQLAIAGITLFLLPFATTPLVAAPGIVAFFAASIFATEIATCYLLFASFEADRQWEQLLLANAYLYSALMAVAHVLTFPGAILPEAPLLAASQGAAWIFVLWIVIFSMWCLAACMTAVAPPIPPPRATTLALLLSSIAGTCALVLVISAGCILLGPWMPALVSAGTTWTAANLVITFFGILCCLATIALISLRLRANEMFSWLSMVMAAVACANLIAVAGGGRYTLGWTVGRLMWLVSGAVLLVYFLAHHVRQRRALAQANELLGQQAGEAAAQLAAIVSSTSEAILSKTSEGIITSWNQASERLLGYRASEIIGRSVRDLIPPNRQGEEDKILSSINNGVRVENYETERIHKSGRPVEISITVSPLRVAGRLIGASSIMHDISERKRRERQATLLLREVNHRAKNMLAVVQSVARQTIADDPQNFLSAFLNRVGAISTNHDLLVETEWRGVDLEDLARAELVTAEKLIGTRISISGPSIRLTGAAGQAIGMAIHELATNSQKYGALSSPNGTVRIDWTVTGQPGDSWLQLKWEEAGGPTVAAPERRGFGTVLIVEMPRTILKARVNLDYISSGVRWSVEAPLANVVEQNGSES